MNLHILICGGWVDNNMNITYNMNTTGVVLVLCISCSLCVAGSFFGGFIDGTEPHFLKVIEADKAKEVYSLAVKLREKHKNELSKFSNPGPGGSDLDEDEYDEYKKITDKLKEETRDSFFCKKAIAFDIKGSKKVRVGCRGTAPRRSGSAKALLRSASDGEARCRDIRPKDI